MKPTILRLFVTRTAACHFRIHPGAHSALNENRFELILMIILHIEEKKATDHRRNGIE